MTYQQALKALDQLYAELPAFTCERKCQDACGVIVMSRVEWLRITRQLGFAPKGKAHLTCPMLKNGGCVIHTIRPMVCRLFGLMNEQRMRCPFGCKPARLLSELEGAAYLMRAEEITEALFPDTNAESHAYALRHKQGERAMKHLDLLLSQGRRG